MTRVRLKGVLKITRRLADGSVATYWYAWRGGPRLPGKPGTPEFIAAYAAAHAERKTPRNDTLAGLVVLYQSKPEYLQLSDSTKREWKRWLDRIAAHDIGQLTYSALEDSRVRADLINWRDEYAHTARAADYGAQVLSRVLGFAVHRGILSVNRAAAMGHLWEADRADLIWEPTDLAKFTAKAPLALTQALRLACLTGLRRGDLVALKWDQVGDLAIVISTGKSKGQTTATIPLLKEARDLLAEINRKDGAVLLNAHGRPWEPNSLSHRIAKYAAEAGVERSLHDARGTFATRLRLAGLTEEEIAEVMGWERDRVRRILARYVDQERIVKALVRKVAANEKATRNAKRLQNAPGEDGSD